MPVFKINNSGKRLRDESEETKEVRNRLHQNQIKDNSAEFQKEVDELTSNLKIVTNFGVLLRLAKAQADAEKEGDPDKIKKATQDHESYRQLCLKADRMDLGYNRKFLDNK